MFVKHIALSQPAKYEIRVQDRLTTTTCKNDSIYGWFQGDVSVAYEGGEPGIVVTVLTGMVMDQAALFGLLTHIRDLGLILLYVNCLSACGNIETEI